MARDPAQTFMVWADLFQDVGVPETRHDIMSGRFLISGSLCGFVRGQLIVCDTEHVGLSVKCLK